MAVAARQCRPGNGAQEKSDQNETHDGWLVVRDVASRRSFTVTRFICEALICEALAFGVGNLPASSNHRERFGHVTAATALQYRSKICAEPLGVAARPLCASGGGGDRKLKGTVP